MWSWNETEEVFQNGSIASELHWMTSYQWHFSVTWVPYMLSGSLVGCIVMLCKGHVFQQWCFMPQWDQCYTCTIMVYMGCHPYYRSLLRSLCLCSSKYSHWYMRVGDLRRTLPAKWSPHLEPCWVWPPRTRSMPSASGNKWWLSQQCSWSRRSALFREAGVRTPNTKCKIWWNKRVSEAP